MEVKAREGWSARLVRAQRVTGEKVKRSRARSLLPSFTPAMTADVTDKLTGTGDIVKLLEDWQKRQ